MADHAVSDDPAVQRQLDRLASLSPGADVLGLERISTLCARLGHPERALPPVFHVAGTNGKGSTCAYLRAALEASGRRVHVYTSPHLVRFNERIRVAGRLIDDALLAALLEEVLAVADGMSPSFFEVTTAAAFLAFARTPADACVIEVGLGGRLDATNVLPAPVACGIAQLGLDHQFFLGDTIEAIAGEKGGIAKAGAPLVTLDYPPSQAERVAAAARAVGAPWFVRNAAWRGRVADGRLHYSDAQGALDLPLPALPGAHQATNASLAIAMLRHQDRLPVSPQALATAMGWADWPARLQRLDKGPLPDLLPPGSELWLDGGHNPAGAEAVAAFFRERLNGRPFCIVMGQLANKDVRGWFAPFAGSGAEVWAVPVPGHDHHSAETIAQAAGAYGMPVQPAPDPVAAIRGIGEAGGEPPVVLVGGTLYMAGAVLVANGTLPS